MIIVIILTEVFVWLIDFGHVVINHSLTEAMLLAPLFLPLA